MMNKLLKIFVVTTFFLSGFAFVNEASAYINISQNVNCENVDEALQNLDIATICKDDSKCVTQAKARKGELELFKQNCDDSKKLANALDNIGDKSIDNSLKREDWIDYATAPIKTPVQMGAGIAAKGAATTIDGVKTIYTSLSGYDKDKPTTVEYIPDSNMTCRNVDQKIKDLEKGKYLTKDEKTKQSHQAALKRLKDFQSTCQNIKKAFPNSMQTIDDKHGITGLTGDYFYAASKILEKNADYNDATLAMLTQQAENGNTNAQILLKNYKIKQEKALQANSHLTSEYYAQAGHATMDQTTPGNLTASIANYDRQKKQNEDIKANMTDEDIEKAKQNGAYDDSYEKLHEVYKKPQTTLLDNSACDIAAMQQKYQSSCYSCKIILTLITTFMNACAKVYDLTREAGSKVLIIGSLIWMAVFSLQIVSSFTNQEPMSILNTFFIFMFKVTIAYIMLNAGVAIIINLFVNPLLMAGADYGIGLMQAANKDIINIATTTNYAYNGTEVISAKVINKLMALTQGIDKTVATNLVIGHALTCHSFHAGSISLSDFLDTVGFSIRIPDIWIWLCGAAIWFCGFMLTLGVGYYLLDVCFKIGFCIIALPIVIGLWPFSKTKDKFTSCMSIIFRSAGLFAFLALTVSYALTLISASLGDLTVFFDRIKASDHVWVSNTFSISGSQFIIIMFAYVYSIKMVGATVTGYLDEFFKDNVFGSASPIHHKATQMTDFAKKKVTQAASFAGGVVTHQATRAAGAAAGGTARMVKKGFQKGKSALSKSGNKPKNNE